MGGACAGVVVTVAAVSDVGGDVVVVVDVALC